MKERGYLESRGRGVCWNLECSLARPKQPAVAEHRQVQLFFSENIFPVLGEYSTSMALFNKCDSPEKDETPQT